MSGPGTESGVALRPWLAPKKKELTPEEATALFNQFTTERAQHFRYIDEQSLQDEIDTGKAAEGGEAMEVVEEEQEEKKDAPTRESRIQELQMARGQIGFKVDTAFYHVSLLLDLVQLALSRDPTKGVKNFHNQMVRQFNIPPGSMGITKSVPMPKHHHAEIMKQQYDNERIRLASRGSRMKALDWATDNILKAATQLETEVRREVKYWDEILSVSEKGWSLQRLRKDQRHSPFAVRHGYREANPHFKDRGFAPLLMDKDGSIILDPVLKSQSKALRVRIIDDGKITGTSSLLPYNDDTASAIEQSLQLARDSLFEEEIFHEMCLESRHLLAYGVELRNSVIQVEPPSSERSRKIFIDLIPRDEELEASVDHTNDWLAHNVAESLRLLLTHEHRMRRFQRTQTPEPLSVHKRATRSPQLLRTLIAVFGHLDSVDAIHSYLASLAKTLKSAGLNVTLHVSRETAWESVTKIIERSPREDLPLVDQFLELFVKPFDSVATLSLPSSPTENITMAARTSFASPTYGTEYKVTLPPSLSSVVNLPRNQARPEFKFPSLDETTSYVDWIVALDLSHRLLLKQFGKRAAVRSQESRLTVGVRHGNKVTKKEIAVEVMDGSLIVSVGLAPLPVDIESAALVLRWDGNKGEGDLKERVKSALG